MKTLLQKIKFQTNEGLTIQSVKITEVQFERV